MPDVCFAAMSFQISAVQEVTTDKIMGTNFAGLMELFRTQGLWLESLRLALQQCTGGAVAGCPSASEQFVDVEQGTSCPLAPTRAQLQVCPPAHMD